MSAFRLPSQCIKEIESLCSAFLWSDPDLNTHKAKVAWDEVCRPKTEGGLGIRRLKDVNVVSVLKLIWRIVSVPSSLWVSWLQTYLVRRGSFWSVNSSSQIGSWMWKKVLKLRPLAQAFHRAEINNGRTTSFWYDNWTEFGRLQDILGTRGYIDLGISEHATVAEVLLMNRRRKHRNQILNRIETVILRHKEERVEAKEDVALWRYKQDTFKAKFSSASTWHQIRKDYDKQDWAKCIWFPNSTPKYTFLTWLALRNRLSTGDRTRSWNQANQSQCVFCSHPLETRDHIFFDCSYATEVWKGLAQGLFQNNFSTHWSDIVTYIGNSSLDYSRQFIAKYLFQAAVYGIWRERNLRKHGETPSPASRLIKVIDKIMRNRLITAQMEDSKLAASLMLWFSIHT